MAIRHTLITAALSLAGALLVLLALGYLGFLGSSPGTPAVVDHGQADWGQKAREIAARDPGVIAALGPDPKEIGGIIWNASVADVFYAENDTYYRVEVSSALDKVTFIRVESDPEVLAWLTNASATATPATPTPTMGLVFNTTFPYNITYPGSAGG